MLTDVNHKGTENAIQIHSTVWWSRFNDPFSNKDTDPLAGGTSVQCSDLECTENKSSFTYDGEPVSSPKWRKHIHRTICSKAHVSTVNISWNFKYNLFSRYSLKNIFLVDFSNICTSYLPQCYALALKTVILEEKVVHKNFIGCCLVH